jgi:type IV pilus assembly protein PilX
MHKPSTRGMVLVVVLMLLMAISLIAALASKDATMGERQARNEMEYQIARQAADAALRDAERDLQLSSSKGIQANAVCARTGTFRADEQMIEGEFTDTCPQGECLLPSTRYTVDWNAATTSNPGEAWWPISKGGMWGNYFVDKRPNTSTAPDCTNFTGSVPFGLYTGAAPLAGVVRQPEYLIESIRINATGSINTSDAKPFECLAQMVDTTGIGLASADGSTGSPTMRKRCYQFRITARAWGPTMNTEVLLQNYFTLPVN